MHKRIDWLLPAALALALFGCRSAVPEPELGICGDETLPGHTPNITRLDLAQYEFVPYGKAFSRRADGALELKLPELPGKPAWVFSSIGPVPVKPATHYRLEIAVAKNHRVDWSWFLEYSRSGGGTPHGSLLWRETGPGSSSGNVSSWDILTPSDATGLKLWFTLTEGQKPPVPGTKAVFNTIRLVELDTPEFVPASGELLPWQLSAQADGPASIAPEQGSFSNINPTVGTVDGEKVLKLEFGKGKSLYAFLLSRPMNLNGALVSYRFEARGSGWLRPGIWWKRTPVEYFYSHGYPVALTPEWQTVELEQGCTDWLATQFALAFTNAGTDTVAEVRRIAVAVWLPQCK